MSRTNRHAWAVILSLTVRTAAAVAAPAAGAAGAQPPLLESLFVPKEAYVQEPARAAAPEDPLASQPAHGEPDPLAPQAVPAQARWQASAGSTLHDAVQQWVAREGYELVWDANYDFAIRADLRIDGTFFHALRTLFESYATAGRPLTVDVYKEQKLVHVSAREE